MPNISLRIPLESSAWSFTFNLTGNWVNKRGNHCGTWYVVAAREFPFNTFLERWNFADVSLHAIRGH